MKTFPKESGKKKNYSTELPCLVCGVHTENGNTFHHVKTRGSNGSDDSWNLMPLCQSHHNDIHQFGLTTYAGNFSAVRHWLISNGWEYSEFNHKWSHSC